MKIGTKSVLYGAHCFLLHPAFVFIAWWRLYGFPFDSRLWLAFIVHDLGYWGKPNMDGKEGETHVEFGAKIMGKLFGKKWADFARYHSRFYAKKDGVKPSRLCIADKLAIAITPAWLYLPMVNATGEIKEYMAHASNSGGKYKNEMLSTSSQKQWYKSVQTYLIKWVNEHKDGKADNWTKAA